MREAPVSRVPHLELGRPQAGEQRASHFFDTMGLTQVSVAPGRVAYTLSLPDPTAPGLPAEIAPAPATIAAAADIVCVAACGSLLPDEQVPLTLGLWVHFLRPADASRTVALEASATHTNDLALFSEGRVDGADGAPLASIRTRCFAVSVEPSDRGRVRWRPASRRRPAAPWLPVDWLSLDAGRAEAALTHAEHLTNNRGAVHGGGVVLLAEAVARRALADADAWTLLDVEARYIRAVPAAPGAARCAAWVRHEGRSAATVTWEIGDATGRVAALGSASWLRRPAPGPRGDEDRDVARVSPP